MKSNCGSCGKYHPIKGARRGDCKEPKRKNNKTKPFPWSCLCGSRYWMANPETNQEIIDLRDTIKHLENKNRALRETMRDLRGIIMELKK